MIKTTATDEQLIAQARAGQQAAFSLLVQRHEARVRGTVKGMLGNDTDADDVTQEVFIRFFEKIDQFRGDAQLSTYLGRMAINLSLNALQRKKRRRWLSLVRDDGSDIPYDRADGNSDPSRVELRDVLQQALAKLSPDFRSVVVLRLIEGYSVQETADILGLKPGTIGSRLARAQQQLRQWLPKNL